MFQSYALLPHLTVAENIRFPLRMRRIGSRAEQQEKVRAALETVQLRFTAAVDPDEFTSDPSLTAARAVVPSMRHLAPAAPAADLTYSPAFLAAGIGSGAILPRRFRDADHRESVRAGPADQKMDPFRALVGHIHVEGNLPEGPALAAPAVADRLAAEGQVRLVD